MPIYKIVAENQGPRKNKAEKDYKPLVEAPFFSDKIDIEDGEYISFLRKVFYSLAEERNFKEVSIPIFESVTLFEKSIGYPNRFSEEILEFESKKTFDRNNRFILRPDPTPSIARKYIQDKWYKRPQPVKISWFGELFKLFDVAPNLGFNQFHQLDLEILGSDSPSYDVEVIKFAYDFLSYIGIKDYELEINSVGCRNCMPRFLENLAIHLESCKSSLCEKCMEKYNKNPELVLMCNEEKCERIVNLGPKIVHYLCDECEKNFAQVKNGLEKLGIRFSINGRLFKKYSYYTKTIFEAIFYDDFGSKKYSILGGGRYDYLISDLGGPETPSVGFSVSIERLMTEMKERNIKPSKARKKIYIASIGKDSEIEISKVSPIIQSAGFKVFKSSGPKGISEQLAEAEKLGISWVILIGEHEIETNTLLLRNITTGTQEVVLRENLIEVLYNKIGNQ